ncbi:MAG: hypothetical protein IPF52_01135 [Saprospiraceae bacterium]|nr:hypothetical protein [Saprospiraceae bacterium]
MKKLFLLLFISYGCILTMYAQKFSVQLQIEQNLNLNQSDDEWNINEKTSLYNRNLAFLLNYNIKRNIELGIYAGMYSINYENKDMYFEFARYLQNGEVKIRNYQLGLNLGLRATKYISFNLCAGLNYANPEFTNGTITDRRTGLVVDATKKNLKSTLGIFLMPSFVGHIPINRFLEMRTGLFLLLNDNPGFQEVNSSSHSRLGVNLGLNYSF